MPVFITANLGRHVGVREFLANLRAIDAEAGRGTVIGFQEIDENDTPNEHHGLRKVLDGFRFAGWRTRVPVAFGDRWSERREGVIKAAKGLVRLSPARVITEAELEHDSGAALVAMSVHFPRKDPRLFGRWRSVRAQVKRRLNHHYRRGKTAVVMTDANRVHLEPFHPAQRVLAHKGLDWVICVEHPDGVQIELVETFSIGLTIDGHDAQGARVELTAPKEIR